MPTVLIMSLKVQAELIWKIKDALNGDLNSALLKEMLLANGQKTYSSVPKVSSSQGGNFLHFLNICKIIFNC